jgi:CheY-like chemotaxis protein
MLQKLNCQIEIANNGSEAVEKAKKEAFPLVFMDLEVCLVKEKCN